MGTLDLSIGAYYDDGCERESDGLMDISSSTTTIRSNVETFNRFWALFRFVSGSLPQKGALIDVCYISLVPNSLNYDDINTYLHFQFAASPLNLDSSLHNITSRTRTIASVPWIQDSLGISRVNSPSLVIPAQELWDSFNPTAIAVIFRPTSPTDARLEAKSYGANGAILHLEWHDPLPPDPPSEAYELDQLKDAIENMGFDDNSKVVLPVGKTSDGKHQFIQVDADGKVVTTT